MTLHENNSINCEDTENLREIYEYTDLDSLHSPVLCISVCDAFGGCHSISVRGENAIPFHVDVPSLYAEYLSSGNDADAALLLTLPTALVVVRNVVNDLITSSSSAKLVISDSFDDCCDDTTSLDVRVENSGYILCEQEAESLFRKLQLLRKTLSHSFAAGFNISSLSSCELHAAVCQG